MTRKEQKELALKIAKLNHKITKCNDKQTIENLKEYMMKLLSSLSIEDMIAIDEIIQTKYKYILDK
jgi:hypothetical protein